MADTIGYFRGLGKCARGKLLAHVGFELIGTGRFGECLHDVRHVGISAEERHLIEQCVHVLARKIPGERGMVGCRHAGDEQTLRLRGDFTPVGKLERVPARGERFRQRQCEDLFLRVKTGVSRSS